MRNITESNEISHDHSVDDPSAETRKPGSQLHTPEADENRRKAKGCTHFRYRNNEYHSARQLFLALESDGYVINYYTVRDTCHRGLISNESAKRWGFILNQIEKQDPTTMNWIPVLDPSRYSSSTINLDPTQTSSPRTERTSYTYRFNGTEYSSCRQLWVGLNQAGYNIDQYTLRDTCHRGIITESVKLNWGYVLEKVERQNPTTGLWDSVLSLCTLGDPRKYNVSSQASPVNRYPRYYFRLDRDSSKIYHTLDELFKVVSTRSSISKSWLHCACYEGCYRNESCRKLYDTTDPDTDHILAQIEYSESANGPWLPIID